MRARMFTLTLAVLGLVLVMAVGGTDSPDCPTFKDVQQQPGTFNCAKECMKWGVRHLPKVYGTILYNADSDLCRSGLHAGVIDLSGGSLRFEEITNSSSRLIHGTCRNRICSESITASETVFKLQETKTVISGKVGGDVMIVHNSYFGDKLQVLCLTQDPETHYNTSNFLRWDYMDDPLPEGEVMEPSKVFIEFGGKRGENRLYKNYHALQCEGRSAASDVLAPIIFQEAKHKSQQYTWRANRGEDLDIAVINKDQAMPSKIDLVRHPGPDVPKDSNRLTLTDEDSTANPYHFTLHNTSQEDQGLYRLGDNKVGAYFNIMIRDCPEKLFGSNCQHSCLVCQNGGQCHSYTGECLCPPGFIGDQCQHACPEGWIGTECQFQCNKKTLYVEHTKDGTCQGLTVCLPSPLGCSCPAGYEGPTCNEPCSDGSFGAGCIGSCKKKCKRQECNPHTGSCEYTSDGYWYHYTYPPTNVQSKATGPGELTVSWDDSSYNETRFYFVTYQLKKRRNCRDRYIIDAEKKRTIVREGLEVPLRNLEDDSQYEVCVTTSDVMTGHSEEECAPTDSYTSMQKPTLNVTLSCTKNYYTITCNANVKGSCLHYKGQNTKVVFELSSYLPCNNSQIRRIESKTLHASYISTSQNTYTQYFRGLSGGLGYHMSATIYNDAGAGETSSFGPIMIDGGTPGPVTNLTVAILGEDKVRLMWKDPCPASGEIDHYQIQIEANIDKLVPKSDTDCPRNIDFDGCYDVSRLEKGKRYGKQYSSCYVTAKSGRYSSDQTDCEFDMLEQKPSQAGLQRDREPKDLDKGVFKLTISPPIQSGGKLINCSITGPGKPCVFNDPENELMTCQFENVEAGKEYTINGSCCNNRLCGDSLQKKFATKPKPEFKGSVSIGVITNSTISVTLPKIIKKGDGNSWIFIVIGQVTGDNKRVKNLQSEGMKIIGEIYKGNQMNGGTQRHARQMSQDNRCTAAVRIAGQVPAYTVEFVVGDGKTYKGLFYNCPLEFEEVYDLGVLAVTTLRDQKTVIWEPLASPVKVTPSHETGYHVILIVILCILLIVVVTAVAFYLYKHPERIEQIKARGHKREPAELNNPLASQPDERRPLPILPAISMSSLANESTEPAVVNDPIYINVEREEPIYGNLSRRVPRAEVEGFFNRIINSTEAEKEFSVVPVFMKDMTVGTQPIHKKKNRYRNNLPYDATRVKLKIINNDPNTDYINANHIQGYGNVRYIATQGPKEQSEPTIKDFWRMIVEEQVTAIIMVANFIEGQKSKVGQYLKLGETLTFDNFTIKTTLSEHLPYFTISKVEVFIDGKLQWEVVHYHYTNWPDHGVPEEAYSIAYLTTEFLRRHDQGAVVVHCSAGIGRTGTVLMVLLLNEMLNLDDSLDSQEVLVRLRQGRGRLVENISQYNLALEVLEEVLFGNSTTLTSAELQQTLDRLLQESPLQYKKLKGLSSPLGYKSGSDPTVSHLNRHSGILPSEKHRIFLDMKNGQAESQYINAISVRGRTRKEALIATEHPVTEAVPKFWRMIVERKCPLLILINQYTGYTESEFASLLPQPGHGMSIEGYKIKVNSADNSRSSLIQYSVTVRGPIGPSHDLMVYQVLDWKYGSSTPDNPDVLVNLADLLLQATISQAGSPVICCGNGVIGCGLVAAVTLIIEYAQTEQRFDIYRTVVKLRRCREQFITSEEQFSMLYTSASKYISNFAIYSNFN